MNPKIFISHVSKDKDCFILDFATKLFKRDRCVVDKWEIYPGDSRD